MRVEEEWVPIWVPRSKAARILREVARDLERDDDDGLRDWDSTSEAERRLFFKNLTAIQWRLLVRLAMSEGPTPAAELADALSIQVSDVAGIVGPLNKRAKRERWPSPVRSQGPGEEKGLSLDPALTEWVNDREDDMSYARAADAAET